MSKAKKVLASHLVAAVAPHLGPDFQLNQPPKAVAKTLRKLTKQLLKQQGQAAPAAPVAEVPAAPTAKQARKALASELTATLEPFLTTEAATGSPSKDVTKIIKHLARALAEQRRKHAKRAAKSARTVVVGSEAKALAVASPAPTPAPAPAATPVAAPTPAPARRPAPKRPSAKSLAPPALAATAGE